MKLMTFVALATAAMPSVLAFCCSGGIGGCADGTAGTPCCATQSCNIFCCACGGHCRGTSRRALLSNAEATEDHGVEAAFAAADTNGNGTMSLEDYLKYMNVKGTPDMWVNWFNKHDANGDGLITLSEVTNA